MFPIDPQSLTKYGKFRSKLMPRGFALVATLALMILLTMVAVGLLSLSAVSLRSSSQGMAQGRGAGKCPAGTDVGARRSAKTPRTGPGNHRHLRNSCDTAPPASPNPTPPASGNRGGISTRDTGPGLHCRKDESFPSLAGFQHRSRRLRDYGISPPQHGNPEKKPSNWSARVPSAPQPLPPPK